MDGVAWTDAGIDNTFDNLDQHEQDFTELIHTYGYNDGVQRIGVDNVEINIFGTVVEFSFQDGQLVPVASQWQQGATPMFFYRTLNDGTNDVTVVCDADGKLCVIENDSYLIKGQNGYAWSIGAAPQALVTNAGGKVTMTAYTDEDETTVISMDGYTVIIDLDGLVTVGAITEWIPDLIMSIWANYGCTENITAGHNGKIYFKIEKEIDETIYWPNEGDSSNNEAVISIGSGVSTMSVKTGRCGHVVMEGGPIKAGVYESNGKLTDTTGVYTRFYEGNYYNGKIV